MKRWIAILGLFAVSLGLSPSTGTDAAKLQPVQAVYLYMEEGKLTILTDTGDQGAGADLEKALSDLKITTPGKIFLETAEYLLVSEETKIYIEELYEELRPACGLCLVEGQPEMESAVKYLSAHRPESSLKDYRAGQKRLPKIRVEEGRMYLEQ